MRGAPRYQWPLAALALLVGTVLALHGLTNHRFWDDEANTAIFARNYNQTGRLTAWDGRNLVGFGMGSELDENLENVYMPPLQYWVAAWGLRTFSGPTFAARFPFVVAGIASLLLVGAWSRQLLGRGFPWALPTALLAVTPTYLLYIRNSRYYSLGVLFTFAVLIAVGAHPRRALTRTVQYSAAILCTIGIWQSQYLNAAALLAMLPALLVVPRFRERAHLIPMGIVYATSGLVGLWIHHFANPLDVGGPPDPTPFAERFATLFAWHLEGLATFEFVPVILTLVLIVPFTSARLRGARPLAWRGFLIVGLLVLSSGVAAALSPQAIDIPEHAQFADMRQQVPSIALGAVLSSVALVLLWQAARPIAGTIAPVLVLSNALHLGFLREPVPNFPKAGLRSTLMAYVSENLNDYRTGTDALIAFLRKLPADSVVVIDPPYLAFSPMFYAPDVLYACQLDEQFEAAPHLELPGYLYRSTATADFLVASWHAGNNSSPESFVAWPGHAVWPAGRYRRIGFLDAYPIDRTRPELPWHSFSIDEFAQVRWVRHLIFENVNREGPQRRSLFESKQ